MKKTKKTAKNNPRYSTLVNSLFASELMSKNKNDGKIKNYFSRDAGTALFPGPFLGTVHLPLKAARVGRRGRVRVGISRNASENPSFDFPPKFVGPT